MKGVRRGHKSNYILINKNNSSVKILTSHSYFVLSTLLIFVKFIGFGGVFSSEAIDVGTTESSDSYQLTHELKEHGNVETEANFRMF